MQRIELQLRGAERCLKLHCSFASGPVRHQLTLQPQVANSVLWSSLGASKYYDDGD